MAKGRSQAHPLEKILNSAAPTETDSEVYFVHLPQIFFEFMEFILGQLKSFLVVKTEIGQR